MQLVVAESVVQFKVYRDVLIDVFFLFHQTCIQFFLRDHYPMLKGESAIHKLMIQLLLLATHVTRLTFLVLCYIVLKTLRKFIHIYGVMDLQNN